METTEHVFPLPEIESHKLDHLQEEMSASGAVHNPAALASTPWMAGLLLAAGFLTWLAFKPGRRHGWQ